MNNLVQEIGGILILADESAGWTVGGLGQIDRLILAANEGLGQINTTGSWPVGIFWTNEPLPGKPLPDRCLTHLCMIDNLPEFSSQMSKIDAKILVVTTRLVFDRGGFARVLQDRGRREEAPILTLSAADLSRAQELYATRQGHLLNQRNDINGSRERSDWYFLRDKGAIPEIEKQLLRGTGKTQDGLVARFLNRPISRWISRFLVRTSLLPNQWTLMLTGLSLAGAVLVMRGDYLGFALGAVLYQLHSTLDGCDGEMARLKYLESDLGRKLDGLCDRFTTLLYAVSLGIGLARQPGIADALRWIYPVEGALVALLIGVSETVLSRVSLEEQAKGATRPDDLLPQFVREERAHFNEGDQLKVWAIKNSGLLFLGQGAASFFAELTKRDVFNFGFMLLALCGWPQWILHILALCACGIVVFTMKEMTALRQPHAKVVSPP